MEDQDRLTKALADRYAIEREIGRGGMATVYLAQDLKHERRVAVKVLNPDLAQNLGAERFLREIKTAANLAHPHILPVFDSGEADGFLFYVMPYVEGESLRSRLTQEKQLPVEDAIQITHEIADALAYAHEEGIIHRDVKPANIMLEAGHAVLADFGVAHAVAEAKDDRITRTGTSLGTPSYMSPEQGTGEQDLDGRSDQYALGCVLYEMLTGQPPFTGRRAEQVLWQHVTVDPPPVTVARPSVPESAAEALHRTLAKRPADRFGTMGEFGAALTRPPTPKAAKAPVSARTTPVVLASLAIVVIAWVFWPRPAIAFSQGDSILIADFDNLTGDEVFEKSLNTALEISLGQSSYLTVFPRAKIEATLKRMQRTDTESLSGRIAREVAEREGIGVLVLPSIATVGGEFSLSVRVQDPATGNDLQATGVSAATKNEVLDAVDQLAEWLRSYLGENLTTLSVQRRPLASVTTPSLEALRHFSLGLRHRVRGELEDAKLGYQNAVRIDSTFTAALASLGMLEFEKFSRDDGIDLLKRAIASLDRVTEKERLGILGFYSQAVEGDLEKAAGYYRAGINLYPNDLAFQNNLGWVFFQQGRFAEALENYKEALRIDPDAGVTYDGLNRIYLYDLPNLDSARVWVHRQLSRGLRGKWALDNLGWVHLGQDSLDPALLAFEEA